MVTNDLEAKALWVRQQLWLMTLKLGRGHLPSCFSIVDLLVALYYGSYFRHDPKNPKDPNRDRLIISKGHGSMSIYPILADRGYFPLSELDRYGQPGGLLGMFADPKIPGIETVSDSLGHGLGIGAGMAYAGALDNLAYKTFVILGDAECNEGSVWEAAAFASHYRLGNLVAYIDANRLGILGRPIMLGDLIARWRSFGWEVLCRRGHNFEELLETCEDVRLGEHPSAPTIVILETTKGKGISFMEGKPEWHNRIPDGEWIEMGNRALGLAQVGPGCVTASPGQGLPRTGRDTA